MQPQFVWANLPTLVGQLLQRNRKQLQLALQGRGLTLQAFKQHVLQHFDVLAQGPICRVGRLGERLLECVKNGWVDGDFDHQRASSNPGSVYLTGTYNPSIYFKKVTRL